MSRRARLIIMIAAGAALWLAVAGGAFVIARLVAAA